MKRETIIEIGVSVAFVILLILLLNPFNFWMPSALQMTLLVLIVIVFAGFASLVWHEKAHDEREEYHKMIAGRVGYLLGTVVLVVGIIFQAFSHMLDPWLVGALGIMVIGKILAMVYTRSTH